MYPRAFASGPCRLGDGEIRLIQLEAGLRTTPISCSLETTLLEDAPEYQAVSYAWGSSERTSTILVNGDVVHITANLYSVLLHARQETAAATLWVDALCIYQDDKLEKSQQVQMMGDIFRRATSTFIWLGEPHADDQIVVNFLWQMEHDTELCTSNQLQLRDIPVDALQKFFGRPWFRRLWILQEALLSREPIVHYGRTEIAFSSVLRLSTDLIFDNLGNHRGDVFNACPLKECMHGWDRLRSIVLAGGGGWPLRYALPMTEKMECTLFEDRVYALLGLATAADRKIVRPNYSRPFADVQRHLAAYLLASSSGEPLGALHVMGVVHGGAAEGLPSWSRDWTAPRRTDWALTRRSATSRWQMLPEQEDDLPRGYPSLDGMAAQRPWVMGTSAAVIGSDGLDHLVRFSDDMWTLALRGLAIDTVSIAHVAPDGDPEDLVRACRHLWEGAVLHGATAWEKPEDRLEAFCKSLCRGSYRDADENSRTDCREGYLSWVEGRDKLDPENKGGASTVRPAKNDYGHRVRCLCAGRSLIITKKGFVGLGPAATRAGDLVCHFQGSSDPFLLRHRAGLSEEDQEGVLPMEFVGDTLVIGLMNGEGLKGAEEKDVVEFWIR